MLHLTCVGVFCSSLGRFTKTKMCIWQGGNLGIFLRMSEDWKTMCWYKTNNYVFKGVRQGYEWVFIQAGKSQTGCIVWIQQKYIFVTIFVVSFWCKRVVTIKPNQAPNRRQFEEFEVKTSTVETMLSSRLMPGEKIGKRMGWVVIGEFESGGDTEVIAQKKWTVFGVGRTYLI